MKGNGLTNNAGIVVVDKGLEILLTLQVNRVWTRLPPHDLIDPVYQQISSISFYDSFDIIIISFFLFVGYTCSARSII